MVAVLVKCSNFTLNFYMMGKALTGMLSSAMTGLYMVVLVVICGFGYFRYPSFFYFYGTLSLTGRLPSQLLGKSHYYRIIDHGALWEARRSA